MWWAIININVSNLKATNDKVREYMFYMRKKILLEWNKLTLTHLTAVKLNLILSSYE